MASTPLRLTELGAKFLKAEANCNGYTTTFWLLIILPTGSAIKPNLQIERSPKA
jgi:hypothetical protein